MKVKVIKKFYDLKDKRVKEAGEVFEVAEKRAIKLQELELVSIIEVPEDKKPITRKASPKRK